MSARPCRGEEGAGVCARLTGGDLGSCTTSRCILRMGSSRGCRTEGAVVNGYIHSVNGDPVVLNSADSVNPVSCSCMLEKCAAQALQDEPGVTTAVLD